MTTAAPTEPNLTKMAPSAEEDWTRGELVLPGGIRGADGALHKKVRVREMTGRDEEIIADREQPNGAHKVSTLLARLLVSVDGLEREIDEELAGGLLVGDRDYLLLRLRQMCVGDRVEQVLRCPSTACGAKLDVDFDISELALRRAERIEERYEWRLRRPAFGDDESSRRVALRLPTGDDQAVLCEVAERNPGAANSLLFDRILLKIGGDTRVDRERVRDMSLAARREIVDFLARHSPGPELYVDIQCPECGGDLSYDFDLHGFFLTSGE